MALTTVCILNSASAWSEQPRFIDFGEGALWDTTTKIYWLKNADCCGEQPFSLAIPIVSNVSSGHYGLSDGSTTGEWALPIESQLKGLITASGPSPIDNLQQEGFQNIGGANQIGGHYWSKEFTVNGTLHNYVVNPVNGQSSAEIVSNQKHLVWPIRHLLIGHLTLFPKDINFGFVGVPDGTKGQSIKISNIGTVDVSVSDISIVGDDKAMFGMDKGDGSGGTCGDTPTIAKGESCRVFVTFAPTQVGVRNATLQVTSDAHKEPITRGALSGNPQDPNVSWWKGEDNATDSVGSNNADVNITDNAYAPGKDGQAFNFDGSGAQWISVPHSDSLNINGSHSVAFWVKLNALPPSGENYFLASKLESGAENKRVTVDSTGKVTYYLYGTNPSSVQSEASLVAGEWTHITATFNGTAQNIYVNGLLNATVSTNNEVGNGSGTLYLGYSPEWAAVANVTHPNLLLDEIIWDNRAISANQIARFAKIQPDPFYFNSVTGMPRSMAIVSSPITVTGIDNITSINCIDGDYSISSDGGLNWTPWSNSPGTVSLNGMVRVRLTSSEHYSTRTSATLEIGGISSKFYVRAANLGDPNANGLVSWWKADGNVNDAVGGNDGAKGVSVTVAESNYAEVACPPGATIDSYSSVFGADSNWVNCGMCTIGENSCRVGFSTHQCGDPAPGVAKEGKLDLFYDTSFSPGKVGQAFDFSGNTVQWVSVSNSTSLDVSNSHTASFWVKLNELPPADKYFYLMSKVTPGFEDKRITVFSDGRVGYELYGTTGWGVSSTAALKVGVWTHVTATYDGSSVNVYIDGTLSTSKPASGLVGNGNEPLYIGNSPNRSNDAQFKGQLDEVKWFNQALTAEDIFRDVHGSDVPVDTDNDGIEDNWERTHFGDLATANTTSDYDNDGYTDLQEYLNSKDGIADPDGIVFDPKSANAPHGVGYVGNNLTPIINMLLL